jgi:hypothetical protein
MGEQEPQEQKGECVLNDIDIMFELSNNEVPEVLEERLRYSCDDSVKYRGFWVERYEDIETGDFFELQTTTQCGNIFTSMIVKTEVGEYKIISYYDQGVYSGSKFLINGEETNSWEFTILLKRQKVL